MAERDHFEEGMLWAASTCEGQFPNGCGASTVDYLQPLSVVMVSALVKIWRGSGRKHGVVLHPDKSFGLTHSESSNFQKMRYFDLVRMAFDESGKRIKGFWYLTAKGASFASGVGYCYPKVWTWRGRAIGFEGEPVDRFKLDKTMWTAEDYAEHSRPHEEDSDG